MKKSTIIQELNNQAIKDDYLYKLLRKIQYIYGANLFDEDTEELSEKEFFDILRFSDILSRSQESLNRNIALKIISTLFDDYRNEEAYQLFAQNVMVKLGNFPSLNLLENSGIKFNNKEIAFEKILKEISQKTSVNGMFFTDSQYETFNEIKNSNHYSFSAGTSFGKSFLFSEYVNWIIREKNASENIAFLVPTRALITQVTEDLEINITDKNYKIVTNPDIPKIYSNNKFIFVFTPERLVSYFAKNTNPPIGTMIIDEAQNAISDNERSPIFYHSITIAVQKSVKLYFASPNIPNPEIFLELVGNSTLESKHVLDVNVAQQRYFVDFSSNKYRIYYDFIKNKEYDEMDLKLSDFDDLLIKMTFQTQSIIYCNSVRNTVERAKMLSQRVRKSEDKALLELSKFIKDNIHDKYYLAELIEKGISFHFGALPQEIRKKIEALFKQGKIKYLFTTSTLLQGVNLPAKNVFILSDKIGMSNLTDFDFLNLAGRAGRLSKELYGNIFVIRLDQSSKIDKLLKFDKTEKATSKVLLGNSHFYTNIGNVLENKKMTNKNMPAKQQREIADYAAILTYQLKQNVPSQLVDKFTQNNIDSKKLIKKMKDINIPEDALMVSTTIKPLYQEKVFGLKNPYMFKSDYTASECQEILRALNSTYKWSEEEDGRYLGNEKRFGYYSVLMSEWIQSKPLNVIIRSTIKYHEKNKVKISINGNPKSQEVFSINNTYHINYVINELFKDIENILKFKVKNYVVNYLKLTNQDDSEWQNYLEYGTNDKTIIELQKIGFDRAISMELSNQLKRSVDFKKGFEFNEAGEIKRIDTESILKSDISSEAKNQIKKLLK